MAASSSSVSSTSVSSALIECCVCNEPYDEAKYIPRLIKNCGHTLCEQCLPRIGKKEVDGLVVVCPICRVKTKLNSVEDFHKNFALLEHIHAVEDQTRKDLVPPNCEVCTAGPAEAGCAECGIKYCSACWSQAHRLGNTVCHQKLSYTAIQQSQCSRHKGKITEYVCVEQKCKSSGELICYLCQHHPSHKGHKTELIDQECLRKRPLLETEIEKMKLSVAFGVRVLDRVETLSVDVQGESRVRAKLELTTHFEMLRQQLNQREAELIRQVDTLADSKATELLQQKTEVSKFLKDSYSALHDAKDSIDNASDRIFLASFKKHRDQLARLSSTKLFPDPVVSPLGSVSFGDRLREQVRAHGTLKDEKIPQDRVPTTESPRDRERRLAQRNHQFPPSTRSGPSRSYWHDSASDEE